MVTLNCAGCGTDFKLKAREFKKRLKNGSKDVFCSNDCLRSWQSESFQSRRDKLIAGREEETKECIKCHEDLPLNRFRLRSRKSGLRNDCIGCFSAYICLRYVARKAAVIEFLGGRCSECKRIYRPSSYHFHHKDPSEKEFSWDRLRRRSAKEVYKEIKKCVLICGNCHADKHSGKVEDEETHERLKDSFLQALMDLDS